MEDNVYATAIGEMPLDEAILRLKELSKVISVTDLLTQHNIERIVEMCQIIERMNVPMRMGDEGVA